MVVKVASYQDDSVYQDVCMRIIKSGTPYLKSRLQKETDQLKRRFGSTDLTEQEKAELEQFQEKLSEKFLVRKTNRQNDPGKQSQDDFYEDLP